MAQVPGGPMPMIGMAPAPEFGPPPGGDAAGGFGAMFGAADDMPPGGPGGPGGPEE